MWCTAHAIVTTGLTTAIAGLLAVALPSALRPPRLAAAQTPVAPPGGSEPAVHFAAAIPSPPALQSSRVAAVRRALLLQQTSSTDARENAGSPPSGIALEWGSAPDSQASFVSATGTTILHVLNLDAADYVAEATVIGDAGTMQSRTRGAVVSFTLPGGALQAIDVGASTWSAPWRFSGAMTVHIRACSLDQGEPIRCRIAVADPLFFHPVGAGPAARFYGEGALASIYHAGDLRQSASTSQPRATSRVMGGRPLTVDPAIDQTAREER